MNKIESKKFDGVHWKLWWKISICLYLIFFVRRNLNQACDMYSLRAKTFLFVWISHADGGFYHIWKMCFKYIQLMQVRSAFRIFFLLFLAHLNRRLKWACLITICPLSVVVVVVNFSHFLLLQNHWANFNQTWYNVFLGKRDSSVFK